jgi:hypothetical protein
MGEGVLMTEESGVWSAGTEVAPPTGLPAYLNLTSISCPTTDSCSGVGTITTPTNSANVEGLLVSTTTVPPQRALTVSATGPGSGTISSAPAGISCGSACTTSYEIGTAVTLTATPAAHSNFLGWSGGGCSGTGTCRVPIDSDQTVTATFGVAYTLTVQNSGTGSGVVYSVPAGIQCGSFSGSVCAFKFDTGTQVTLSPWYYADSTFRGWSGGGCSGAGDCEVTVSADTTVNAKFALRPCVVPKIDGKTLTVAKRAIDSHDCTVGKIKHLVSRTTKKGYVISQEPKPGERLKHGAKINFTVSTGAAHRRG